MKITEIAAWWGASVATIVFLWDIYKWRQAGARIRLSVSGNMEAYGHLATLIRPDQTLVVTEVVNVGSKKTTLTQLFGCYYSNWWRRLLRRETKTLFVVPDPVLAQALPFELEAGSRWLGVTYQSNTLEELSRNGYLYIGIFHSVSRKPILRRFRVPQKT